MGVQSVKMAGRVKGRVALVCTLLLGFMALAAVAQADTVTLYPNGAGSSTGWTYTGGALNFTNLQANDADTSYAAIATNNAKLSVALDDTTLTGTISSVQVCVVEKEGATADANDYAQPMLRTGAVNYVSGGSLNAPTAYTASCASWATNPGTLAAWSWTEVNALEAGMNYVRTNPATEVRVTQVYAVVTYTNSAPVISSNGGGASAAISIAENATAVTTVAATDVDAGQTLTYSISGGADAAKFAINSSNGVLSFVAPPNFEVATDAGGNNVYDVIVQVTDNGTPNLSDTQTLAVTVTNANDSPTITSNGGGASAALNVFENSTAVTTVTAADEDGGQTLTYAISGGADAAKFTINSSSGALAFVAAPDFETPTDVGANNVYDVIVQVTDNGTPNLSDTQAIGVAVDDVVEGPACTPAPLGISVVPAGQFVRSGNSQTYTFTITNNDSAACADLTVNLTVADSPLTPNANFAVSTLSLGSFDLAAGASANTTLTVTAAPAGVETSVLTTTVTASASGHANQNSVATTTIDNYNPLIHSSRSTGSSKWGAAGWGVSGGKYGAFDCDTCHVRSTSNIKMIRPDLIAPNGSDQFPIQAASGTVLFQDTTAGNSDFGDDSDSHTTSSKICEGCHTQTKYHNYNTANNVPNGGNLSHSNKADCIVCHEHKQGFKSGGCDSCHGNPPTAATAGGPTGLANNPVATGSTTAGAHQRHAVTLGYSCDNCHNGYVMPNNGDIDIHFSNFGSTTGSYTGQAGIKYNGGTGSGGLNCNNVYCHSTGQSANGASATPSAYSAPAWNGAVACGSCHSATDPATGSHTAHVNAGALCATCHVGNIHVNRNIEVGLGNYTAAGAPGNGYGQCSTSSCHDDGTGVLVTTPTWGTAAACTECHAAAPATGSHASHLTAGSLCGDCHSGAVQGNNAGTAHRDNNIDTALAQGYTQNKAKGSAYESCATATCHNDGRNAGLTGVWGTPLNNCSECHATVPATAGHATHIGVSFGGAAISCASCHTGTTQGTTAGAGHRDGNIDAVGYDTPNKSLGSAYTTCSTATCHQTGISTNNYVTTPIWDANTANCTQCHAASPVTGSHTKHIASTSNCTACHGAAAIKDVSYTSAAHGDYNIDVTVGGYAANKVIGSAYTGCTAVTCHSDGMAASGNAPTWGTASGCAACHLSDMTTGSHAKHLAEVGVDCSDCHADAVKDSTAPTGGVHTDGNVDVYSTVPGDLGYPADRAYGSATWTTCTTASCHDMGRGGLATSPTWGVSKTDCTECHAGAAIATGSHGAHIAAGSTCTSCHDAATSTTSETEPAVGHRDTNVDTNLALGYTQNKAKDSAFTTCATASCHNDGRNAGLTGTWGTTLNNCSECHATVPATGGHGVHVGVSFGGVAIACADCHAGTTQGTTAGAGHRDGNIDVSAGSYPADKALGSAFTTCTTASCHQTGISTNNYVTTPAWDANAANCTACHAASPTTGSHTKHIASTNNCTACHGAAALKDVSYNSAAHGDLNIDVAVGGYAANKAIGSAFTACTNINCHSDGMAATGNTPVWGTASGCAACHASDMTTGSHTKHLAAGSLCGDCHADAVKDSTAPTGGVHADGNVDVYNTAAGDLGYPNNVAYGSATWTTCNAASCHDPGRGALVVTPAWGVSKTDCTECHLGAAISTGSHAAHLAAGATCASCHDDAANPATESLPAAGHLDTNIDTDLALGYTQNKAKNSAFTTCATASCHNDGRNSGLTGTWGTTLNNCSECHATVPTTGSHTDHMALYTCGTCHTGTTQGTTAGAGHRDGNIDTAASTGLTADKTLGSAFTSCGVSNCHGSNSPVWGTDLDANDACTQCHGQLVAGPATEAQKAPGGAGVDTNGDSAATDAQVGAHQIHLNPTISKAVACSACHAVPASITAAGHIDSALPAELTFSGLALGGLDGQAAVAPANSQAGCATVYCHNAAAIKNNWGGAEAIAESWVDTNYLQGTAADCNNCHGYPPAGSHVANSDCSLCHNVLNADDVTFTAAGKLTHVDGIVQASGGDNCSDCHAADVDGVLNGAHAKHADVATYLAGKKISTGGYGGAGWYTTVYVGGAPKYGCGECHPAGEGVGHPTAGLNIDLDPAGETPTAGSLKLKNTNGPTMPTFTSRVSLTCNNVYCHSNASGAVPSYSVTPNWYGGTVSGNCSDCHGNSPNTNAHSAHAVGIHYDTLYDDDAVGVMATSPTGKAASAGADAAHGNSATSDTIGCQSCHNSTVAVEYNAANTICSSCHSDTNTPLTGNEKSIINTAGSTHVNGLADVTIASLASFKSKAQLRSDINLVTELNNNWTRTNGYKAIAGTSFDAAKVGAPNYSAGACSSVACHNGITTPTWTSGSSGNCLTCHTSLPQ